MALNVKQLFGFAGLERIMNNNLQVLFCSGHNSIKCATVIWDK